MLSTKQNPKISGGVYETRTKALLLTSAVSLSMLGSACSAPASTAASTDAQTQAQTQETVQDASAQVSANETEVVAEGQQAPKYVFLFIGDGMSYPQIQLTNYFVSANNQDGAQTVNVDGEDQTVLSSQNNLTMMQFR